MEHGPTNSEISGGARKVFENKDLLAKEIFSFRERVRNNVANILGDSAPTQVDEITDEALFKAYLAYDTFKGESELETWVFKIATNHARDALKKAKRRNKVLSYILDEADSDGPLFPLQKEALRSSKARQALEKAIDISHDPEKKVIDEQQEKIWMIEQKRKNKVIRKALFQLPEKARQIAWLYYIDQKPIKEIVGLTSYTEGGIKKVLWRTRQILQDKLKRFNPNK